MRLIITGAVSLAASIVAGSFVTADAAAAYTVRAGDTLSGIAAASGIALDELVRSNGLQVERPILIGVTLQIPGGGATGLASSYGVRWGDTLSGIAARHGVTVGELADANGLRLTSTIFAGSTLRLPGESFSAAPADAPSAPATPEGGDAGTIPGSLDRWAAHYGVDARLVRAMAWQESGFQQHVVSSTGARGVMQVMPDTWEFVETVLIGAQVDRTADGNVRVGVAYLRHLLRVFGGDEQRAVAAYFQGDASVKVRGLLPETERYVANVLALRSRV